MGEALRKFGEIWLQGLRLNPIDVGIIAHEFEVESTQYEVDALDDDVQGILDGNDALEALRAIPGVTPPDSYEAARQVIEAIHQAIGVCKGRDITELLLVAVKNAAGYRAPDAKSVVEFNDPLKHILQEYTNLCEDWPFQWDDENWLFDGIDFAINIEIPLALLSKRRESFLPTLLGSGMTVLTFQEWGNSEFSINLEKAKAALPEWQWNSFRRGRRHATDYRCFSAWDFVFSTL